LNATYDPDGVFTLDTVVNIFDINKNYDYRFILIQINSKLLSWYYHIYSSAFSQLTLHTGNETTRELPLYPLELNQQRPFIEKADIMLDRNKELHEKKDEFIGWFSSEYEIEKLSNKLKDFHDLSFNDFLSEIKKKASKDKKSVSPAKRKELESYFTDYKEQALAIKQIIDTTDKEIDQMVYELYGLTEDEIKVVEGE
jgi:hypothetical protein